MPKKEEHFVYTRVWPILSNQTHARLIEEAGDDLMSVLPRGFEMMSGPEWFFTPRLGTQPRTLTARARVTRTRATMKCTEGRLEETVWLAECGYGLEGIASILDIPARVYAKWAERCLPDELYRVVLAQSWRSLDSDRQAIAESKGWRNQT